jgi:hypothetical protein
MEVPPLTCHECQCPPLKILLDELNLLRVNRLMQSLDCVTMRPAQETSHEQAFLSVIEQGHLLQKQGHSRVIKLPQQREVCFQFLTSVYFGPME